MGLCNAVLDGRKAWEAFPSPHFPSRHYGGQAEPGNALTVMATSLTPATHAIGMMYVP